MTKTLFPILALLCLAFGLTACGPSDPLKHKVSATSAIDFDMWKNQASYDLMPDQWADFNEAVQELKLGVEIDHEATGSTAVEAAMLRKIDGKTVGEVIVMGLKHELDRVTEVKAEAEVNMQNNSRLRTNAGDTESAARLAELRAQQDEQYKRIKIEYDRVVGRIRPYMAPGWYPAK